MLVLISYDVSTVDKAGQRRLRRVANTCKDFGQRVQYSVFECIVDPAQWTVMRQQLIDEIKSTHDVVHKDREADRQKILEELRSDELDQELLLDLFVTRRESLEDRLPKILAKFAEFHNSLSDEQKEQIIEHLEAKHRRWH